MLISSFRRYLNYPTEAGLRATLFTAAVLALTLTSVVFVNAQTSDDLTKPDDPAKTHDLTKKSLEDLMNIEVASVYSASKYSQKVTEAPSSVTIVTSEQIQRYGYRTLADILGSVRGFYLRNDRNYTYLGVRGFGRPGDYNTRVLLLVDGRRMNTNVDDQAGLGRELPIDIDLIERVEIVRGSSSSLYGTSAFFAVINVITKRGRDVNGFEVSAEAASYGTSKGRFTYGKKLNDNLEVLLSGSFYDSRGPRQLYFKEFDAPETNNGIAMNADDEDSKSFFADVSFREFSLQGAYGDREKGIPTAAFATVFNNSGSRTTDQRGYIDLRYDHTFSNRLNLVARASYDSSLYQGTLIYADDSTSQLVINKEYFHGRWWGGELQLSKTLRQHRLTLGTEYRDNLKQDQGSYDLDPQVTYLDDRRKSKNFAVFLQDEFTLRENLTLNFGARYDRHSTFGGSIKPRAALIYQPTAKATVKLLYGEAFRAPNNYELYFTSGDQFKSSPHLRPETIRTGELIFERYLGDHVRLSASGYVYRIKGLIDQITDPADGLTTFQNEGQVASKGLEFEIEGKMFGGFEGNLAYTLQSTRDQGTGEDLTDSPKHLGKLNIIAPLLKRRVFAGFQLQYTGPRKTLNGSSIPAFFLSNLTIFSQKIVKGFDVSFGAYNLFNQKYADPGSQEHQQNAIDQNGRNFRFKSTYHF